MTAAKKISEKFETKIFDDVSILQRKWQAALRPGEKLPASVVELFLLSRTDGGPCAQPAAETQAPDSVIGGVARAQIASQRIWGS